MLDSNIKLLLDEIHQREGLLGLDTYAQSDPRRREFVELYKDILAEKTQQDSPIEVDTIIDKGWTGKCNDCNASDSFWWPAECMSKCPNCGSENFDLYAGTYSSITEFDTFSGEGIFYPEETKEPIKTTFFQRLFSKLKR